MLKNLAQMTQRWEALRAQNALIWILSILVIPLALVLGIVIGLYNPVYGIVAAGAIMIGIIFLFRWDDLTIMLIVAVHVIVDWYLAFRLVSLLLALALLFVCYLGRSANHPWVKPRFLWLWSLFLILTIYPAIKGGSYDLYDADTYYPSLVLSAFVMFWLGNILASDISHIQRVFQFLTVFAALLAIHTIIEATTGKFLFESARAQAALAGNSYQLVQTEGVQVSRAGSFFGHPNGNGTFLAISFFLPLGLFMRSKRLWTKMIYLLAMLLILLALMFTYSTGAWIGLIAGMLVFIIFVGQLRQSVSLVIFIAFLVSIVVIFFPSQLALQLSHANANDESSVHIAAWQTAIGVIQAYPLFGAGLGGQAYMFASLPYIAPAQLIPLLEPDNSYLEWGALAGIPVMVLFLLLLGYIFWFSWHTWRTIDVHYRPLIGAGIAALIALSINSLSVNGWTDPGGIQILAWLIAGMITSPFIVKRPVNGRIMHSAALKKLRRSLR